MVLFLLLVQSVEPARIRQGNTDSKELAVRANQANRAEVVHPATACVHASAPPCIIYCASVFKGPSPACRLRPSVNQGFILFCLSVNVFSGPGANGLAGNLCSPAAPPIKLSICIQYSCKLFVCFCVFFFWANEYMQYV